jgi:hypothetical protein
MRAKATALLLAELGVSKSHSRPHTSNDNPFSESHFKTMNTNRNFHSASAVSRMPRPSAAASSIGTIKSITMPESV